MSGAPAVSITKTFDFDAAHRIPNHQGKCRNIHGHRYTLEITLTGAVEKSVGLPSEGMVIDFADLKDIVKTSLIEKWDHAFLGYEGDPVVMTLIQEHKDLKLVRTTYIPTVENMARDAFDILDREFTAKFANGGPSLTHLRMYETATSWADIRK